MRPEFMLISFRSWSPSPTPDEVAFESIKASLDSIPNGVKMVLNAGMRLPVVTNR